jgi:hypothetical protein
VDVKEYSEASKKEGGTTPPMRITGKNMKTTRIFQGKNQLLDF